MVQKRLYRSKKREGSTLVKPSVTSCFSAFYLVPRTGFEPMTYCLEGSCSIQLSYRGVPYFCGAKIEFKFQKTNLKFQFSDLFLPNQSTHHNLNFSNFKLFER